MRSLRQWTHLPHSGANSVTTWSPGRDERHAVADTLDDARALVAEHARHVAAGIRSGGRIEVGVADAAGDEPDERLAGLRVGQLDVLDDEWRAELFEDGGAYLHAVILEEADGAALARRCRR